MIEIAQSGYPYSHGYQSYNISEFYISQSAVGHSRPPTLSALSEFEDVSPSLELVCVRPGRFRVRTPSGMSGFGFDVEIRLSSNLN